MNRPATYSRPGSDLTMALQSASKVMGNVTVGGNPPGKPRSEGESITGGEHPKRRRMVGFPVDPFDENKGRPPQTGNPAAPNVSTGNVSDDRRKRPQSGPNPLDDQSGDATPTGRVPYDNLVARTNPGGSVSGDENEEDPQEQPGNNDSRAHGGGNRQEDRHQLPPPEGETPGLRSNGQTSQPHIPETTGGGGGWNLMKWGGGDEPSKLIKSTKDKQKEAIRVLNQTIEDKTAKIKVLKEEHRQELHEKDTELNTLKKTSKKEKEERDDEIKRLKTWNGNLTAERVRLEDELSTARATWLHFEQQYDMLKRQFEVYRGKAEAKEKLAHERLELVERDNAELREVINKKSRPQEPIYPEDHYIMALDDLNTAIRQFVAKHSKMNNKETLSVATQTKVINELAQYGKYGQISAEVLKPRLLKLYTSSQFRIPLLRHIFTLFLFDRVLDLFAYPVDSQISEYLKGIEAQLFHQG